MMTHEPITPRGHGPGRGLGLRRVLVATDFSPHSACALERARQLPLQEGAELLLVHALPSEATGEIRHGEEEALARHALEEAVHHTRGRLARGSCEVRGLLVRGKPLEAITRAARDFGAELVVIGRPRIPGSLLARLRERMAGGFVESIPTALLVVGPPPVGPYQHPLIAVELTEASRHAVEAALRLCPNASRVAVLHDYDTSYELVLHQAAPSRIPEFQREARTQACAELHRFLTPYREAGVHFDELIGSGEASTSTLELAQEEHADLVVVGRHTRLGLGRLVRPHVARQIIKESTCDVLILEQEDLPREAS
ncbi:universal stress protein [Archangium violaceum]|uniref:universal stress protein n=1 Tax=Archangium violaceum TaxID=83451 RepID=UPI00193B6C10|nr:universal stress protein [Archangium violaceum]QRK04756.1 universal stress protein [Archangium violaceum]